VPQHMRAYALVFERWVGTVLEASENAAQGQPFRPDEVAAAIPSIPDILKESGHRRYVPT
jgi:hypothetical protein